MIDRKGIYIGILVASGAVFATLLTFLVYKIWKYLYIRKNLDWNSKDEIIDEEIFYPHNVPIILPIPSTYAVAAQHPIDNEDGQTAPPMPKDSRFNLLKNAKKATPFDPGIKESDEDVVLKDAARTKIIHDERNLLPPRHSKDVRRYREQKKKVIDLRGSSLTEDMFYDYKSRNPPPFLMLPEHESSSSESLLDDVHNESASKKAGKIRFKTKYDEEEKTLQIRVIKAYDIAPDREMDEIKPFIRLSLYPGKKLIQNTKAKKEATKEPLFNEVIIFRGLTLHDICTYKLKLKVCNNVRGRKKEVLGEAELNLSSIDQKDEKEFTVELHLIKKEVSGSSLTLTVNHEFVNNTLSVVIHDARVPKYGRSILNINPFVTLEFFSDATRVDKKQTTTKSRTMEPFYNETFYFPITCNEPSELKTYSLILTVRQKHMSGKCKKLGFVLLSSSSPSQSARDHWEKVIEVADTRHKAIHSLLTSDV